MATVTIVIDDTNGTISQLNQLLGTYMGGSYKFITSSANASAGATYTATNGAVLTIVKTITAGLVVVATSPTSPNFGANTLTLTSGTGDATITYTSVQGTSDSSNLCNLAVDYLTRASMGGLAASTVQVTVRDTDPAVATSGTGSTQVTVSVG